MDERPPIVIGLASIFIGRVAPYVRNICTLSNLQRICLGVILLTFSAASTPGTPGTRAGQLSAIIPTKNLPSILLMVDPRLEA